MRAGKAGCVVIDNTSQFRYQDDIPLVVAEVNPHAIAGYSKHNIIANPNCSTMQMLVALKPLHDAAQIERINVATYQSVSGGGQKAVDELASRPRRSEQGGAVAPKVIAKQIAFNCVPQIDVFLDNGYTKEEMKMVWETQKIMEDPSIRVNADRSARRRVRRTFGSSAHRDAAQADSDAGRARNPAERPGRRGDGRT